VRDVVVVGGGAMGAAAAWDLAGRGRDVVLLEQFARGHDLGSSHGSSRVFRLAHHDPIYVDLARAALDGWRAIEEISGAELRSAAGAVLHGNPEVLASLASAMRRHEVDFAELSAGDARERWPGFRFEGSVIHEPAAGSLHADHAVRALLDAAEAASAELRFDMPVRRIRMGDDHVEIETDAGTLVARRAVVTAGVWAPQLLGGVVELPSIRVTQEQPAHFAPLADGTSWPSFVHYRPSGMPAAYGVWSPDGEGLKVGLHGAGVPCTPGSRTFRAEPQRALDLERYVDRWVPGVDARSGVALTCLYGTTENEDFVIDRIGPLVVATGFSGQGFKYVPAIGRMLGDLVLGRARREPRFSLRDRAAAAAHPTVATG
jgi:sarcosine oxidase